MSHAKKQLVEVTIRCQQIYDFFRTLLQYPRSPLLSQSWKSSRPFQPSTFPLKQIHQSLPQIHYDKNHRLDHEFN